MQTTYYGRSRPDYDCHAIILRDGSGKIAASVILHSRSSRFLGKRLFYAPRGPIFSTPEQFREIIQEAKAYCKNHKGYLLRIDPPILSEDHIFRGVADQLGFHFDPRKDYSTYQPKCVYQTQLAGLTEEDLLYRFHAKTRYNIRLAQRRGVTIREGDLSHIPLFHAMMEETGRRDGFRCKAKEFYTTFLTEMNGYARLLLAEKNGEPLASAIEVILGKKAWYVYGCSFSHGREDMPNYLLQWEMMGYALNQGCTIYDFRGVEGNPTVKNPHYGLHRFKQGFAGNFVEYMGQMDLILCPRTHRIMRFLQNLP